MTKEEILEGIKSLSVIALADLVKALEDEFGVSAAPVAVAAAAPAAAAPAAGDSSGGSEEQTDFTVTIKEAGPNKINAIKAVREVTSLGLREAKELVESAPKPVREGGSKEEAEEVKGKLEASGAIVEIS